VFEMAIIRSLLATALATTFMVSRHGHSLVDAAKKAEEVRAKNAVEE
jgi:hypothetical protein